MSLSIRRDDELPYLRAFHAVCRSGGVSAAARQLGCTQPSVSYQIRALERTLRVRLFERQGRTLIRTPAGDRLHQFCTGLFNELANVRAACTGTSGMQSIRLCSVTGFGRYVLMPALEELMSGAADSMRLELSFDAADVILARLERGECEAAFVYLHRWSNALRFRRAYEEELVLIAPPTMRRRLARANLRRVSAFEAFPFVTYQEGDYVFGRWFDAIFGDQPSITTSVAQFSELEEVIRLVGAGAGLSVVPRDAVAAQHARKEVDIVDIGPGLKCINEVFMVQRAASAMRPELSKLATILAR